MHADHDARERSRVDLDSTKPRHEKPSAFSALHASRAPQAAKAIVVRVRQVISSERNEGKGRK